VFFKRYIYKIDIIPAIYMVPKKVFFTKGVGKHKNELQSFELALRNAGIEKCNLVNVSSIVPPQCKIISREKGIQELKPGNITYCVMSRNSTREPNRLVGAAIGVAIPKEKNSYGYISMSGRFVRTQSIVQTAQGDKNGLWTTVLAAAVFLED